MILKCNFTCHEVYSVGKKIFFLNFFNIFFHFFTFFSIFSYSKYVLGDFHWFSGYVIGRLCSLLPKYIENLMKNWKFEWGRGAEVFLDMKITEIPRFTQNFSYFHIQKYFCPPPPLEFSIFHQIFNVFWKKIVGGSYQSRRSCDLLDIGNSYP